jgi:hypothetical protein
MGVQEGADVIAPVPDLTSLIGRISVRSLADAKRTKRQGIFLEGDSVEHDLKIAL